MTGPNDEPVESNDDRFIREAMEATEATAMYAVIPDAAARMIASQYHGGQTSALYSLTSAGAIDTDSLRREITSFYVDESMTVGDLRKLDHLAFWIMAHGNRGPVEGWSELWGQPEQP